MSWNVYLYNSTNTKRWRWVQTPRSERETDCDKCAFTKEEKCPVVIPCDSGYWEEDKEYQNDGN